MRGRGGGAFESRSCRSGAASGQRHLLYRRTTDFRETAIGISTNCRRRGTEVKKLEVPKDYASWVKARANRKEKSR
jgi:hypothetical protein